MYKYIDVSTFQGEIDWERVKPQIDGAILRAGYGAGNIDAQFVRNITECNRLNIPVGVYWFSYAHNAAKALAEADGVKITNTEQATRILVENIVEPLKQELNETRKDLGSTKREMARLRKAIDDANSCRYSAECPVLDRMRNTPKERDGGKGRASIGKHPHGQRDSPGYRQRKRTGRNPDGASEGADVGGDVDDSDGQPP